MDTRSLGYSSNGISDRRGHGNWRFYWVAVKELIKLP